MLSDMGYLTSAQGRLLRGKCDGRMRAAFWRRLGFPNLVLARAARAEKRRIARMRAELRPFQQTSLTVQPPYSRMRERL
jgi:hypothetical protein